MHNLWKIQEKRKKKLICSKCGKIKEEEDDLTWITVNGNHIPIGKGEDKQDAVDKFFADKRKINKNDIKTKPTPTTVYHASWNKDNIDKLIDDKGKFDPSKAGQNFKDHGNTNIGLYTSNRFQNQDDGGGITQYGSDVVKIDIDKSAKTVDIKDIQKELKLTRIDVITNPKASAKVLDYAKANKIDLIRDSNYHDAFHIIVNPDKIKGIKRVKDQFESYSIKN